jgi:hypothetical protein
MAKRINNPLTVKRFMENNPLAQAFVLSAIYEYALLQLTTSEWEGATLISQAAWRRVAEEALDMVANKEKA